jgi:hypothetical protein
MKTFGLLLILVLGVIVAPAQVLLNTATIDLTSTGTTTISSVASGTGTLNSIACIVSSSSGVTGFPLVNVKVSLDGGVHTTSYLLYNQGNAFNPLAYAVNINPGVPGGESNNDTVLYPFYVPYTSGLTVSVSVTTAASIGQLVCSTLHT